LRTIVQTRPSLIVAEISTPMAGVTLRLLGMLKERMPCRLVAVGPHASAFAGKLAEEPCLDHVIVGEYEPGLEAILHGSKARIQTPAPLSNIDTLPGGANWLPYRDLRVLPNYYEPACPTPKTQLNVYTARGCPFRCTFCQWPKIINRRQYRARAAASVLDEIRTMIRALANTAPVRSIYFEDDTFNVGGARMAALCAGLREIGLPWSMMGRLDTTPLTTFDQMVEGGCVAMKFGVESFIQRNVDAVNKRLSAQEAQATLRQMLARYSGMHFHVSMMKNMPGERAGDWEEDQAILCQLRGLASRYGNAFHWTTADCIAFPGTDLHEEVVASGRMLPDDDAAFDGAATGKSMGERVGWLGENYPFIKGT